MPFDRKKLTGEGSLMKHCDMEGGLGGLYRNRSERLELAYSKNQPFAFFYNREHLELKQRLSATIDMDCIWKAHLSIHPDDLDRSWSIIYPLLADEAWVNPISFKVINPGENLKELKELTNKLSQIKNQEATPDIALEVAKLEREIKAVKRFSEGMQITLYIPPSQEQHHHSLLQKIETALIQQHIRPGEIHLGDRPIGQYTSVRHPGNTYTLGVDVSSYNPADVPDPFETLTTFDSNTTHRFLERLKQALMEQVTFLKSSKSDGSKTSRHNTQVKLEFAEFLEKKVGDFFSPSHNVSDQIKGAASLEKEITSEMNKVDKKIINDKGWKAFSLNLLMLCSVILTLPAILSIGQRAITGRYAIFDNKEKPEDLLAGVNFKERFRQVIEEVEPTKDETATNEIKPASI
jgi:hypothetical protein